MKTKLTLGNWLAWLIMAAPAVYLASIYSSLPNTVPTHFGLHGADAWGEKAEAWVFVGILTAVELFVYLLLRNISFIDPKKNLNNSGSMIEKISFLMVIFISLLQLIIINAMQGKLFGIEKLLLPLMSLFFALLGNLMMHVKPNYFVGIRVPWTLENEDNWRKTHRLAGRLWFGVGILLAVITLVLPFTYAFVVFIVGITTIAIIPIAYSYTYFRKQQNDQP